ncbi:immune inhibitor A domain-containing protein [Thermoactinomyces sp. DSM 45892]|uniref:immune inhibitor A domain-containing protein n=1 Tax=Thermoactinomyces sp. DSM 45892 TaxID=1882753 RepID=UPI00089B7AE9|nr:immune inhibitor A domain-containing protein [Thermoactinomyces sp. DSM 45892]SDZ23731.1 immune inhibitor A [Thermoactinomyces sp. DSM 45892]
MNTYKKIVGMLSIALVVTIANVTVPTGIVNASAQKDKQGIDISTEFGRKAEKNLLSIQKQALEKKSMSDSKKTGAHTDYTAVSLIEFQNLKHNQIKPTTKETFYTKDFNPNHYKDMLFQSGAYRTPEGVSMPSMNQFYKEQSENTWSMQGTVAPWMQAKNKKEYYGVGGEFEGFDGFKELAKETLEQVGQTIKGNEDKYDQRDPYDLDGDGNVMEPDGLLDNLTVVVAGSNADLYVVPHQGTLKEPVQIPGTSLKAYSYMMVPEDTPVGTFAHEYGHNLGLPDLYNQSVKGESLVGNWSLMDLGASNGKISGIEPVEFNPQSKLFLQATYGGNWIKPIEVDLDDLKEKKEILLDEAVSKNSARKVIKVNLPPVEKDKKKYPRYYLIEWRSHNGLDKGLQHTFRGPTYDPGMVVWYYDGSYDQKNNYGMIGVVDAHPQTLYWNNDKSKPAENAFQLADAAFGLRKTTPLKVESYRGKIDSPSQEGVPIFNDQNHYSLQGMESIGDLLPKLGLQFKVSKESNGGRGATIEISKT